MVLRGEKEPVDCDYDDLDVINDFLRLVGAEDIIRNGKGSGDERSESSARNFVDVCPGSTSAEKTEAPSCAVTGRASASRSASEVAEPPEKSDPGSGFQESQVGPEPPEKSDPGSGFQESQVGPEPEPNASPPAQVVSDAPSAEASQNIASDTQGVAPELSSASLDHLSETRVSPVNSPGRSTSNLPRSKQNSSSVTSLAEAVMVQGATVKKQEETIEIQETPLVSSFNDDPVFAARSYPTAEQPTTVSNQPTSTSNQRTSTPKEVPITVQSLPARLHTMMQTLRYPSASPKVVEQSAPLIPKRQVSQLVITKPDKITFYDSSRLRTRHLGRNLYNTAKTYEVGNVELAKVVQKRIVMRPPPPVPKIPEPEPEDVGGGGNHLTLSLLMDNLNDMKMRTPKPRMEDPENTYFMGMAARILPISDACQSIDFTDKALYDQVNEISSGNHGTETYVRLAGNNLCCYGSKPVPMSNAHPESAFFTLPHDQTTSYLERYRIDLMDAQLFLMTGKSLYKPSLLFCCKTIDKASLHALDDLDIKTVVKFGDEYCVTIQREDGCELLLMPTLRFVICKDSRYHTYEVKTIGSFMKWVMAIQLRCKRALPDPIQ